MYVRAGDAFYYFILILLYNIHIFTILKSRPAAKLTCDESPFMFVLQISDSQKG